MSTFVALAAAALLTCLCLPAPHAAHCAVPGQISLFASAPVAAYEASASTGIQHGITDSGDSRSHGDTGEVQTTGGPAEARIGGCMSVDTGRWNQVAWEAWDLVRREYVDQGLLDRGLDVTEAAPKWLQPRRPPLKLALRFFQFHLELQPFGKLPGEPPAPDAGKIEEAGEATQATRKNLLGIEQSQASTPSAAGAESHGQKEGRGITWDEVGRRLRERDLCSQEECHEAIVDMMALLPDRYSLFYRPAGLEKFVDGIDPVQTPVTGGIGVAVKEGWRARVVWADNDEFVPASRIHFSRAHWVRRVLPASPAARSGIVEGDVILSMWGEEGIGREEEERGGASWERNGGGEESAGKWGRGLQSFRKTGEKERVGGAGQGDTEVETLLNGMVGDRVRLKILSVGGREERDWWGGWRAAKGFGGRAVMTGQELRSKFGGPDIGGQMLEVLCQREVRGREAGRLVRDAGAGEAKPGYVGKTASVWEREAGGERGGERDETCRLIELRMARLRSEEAAWGKVLYTVDQTTHVGRLLDEMEAWVLRLKYTLRSPVRASVPATGLQVATNRLRKTGYIRVFDFNTRTVDEVSAVVEHLRRSAGGPCDLYILDLRGNMGGLLTAGIGLVEEFLRLGSTITSLEGSDGHQATHFARRRSTLIPHDSPVVVVIDGFTASSSELAAAALADNGRATLVGTPSFGKGSIQAIVRLSDDSGLQLTIGKFRSLHDSIESGRGIKPHFHLPALPRDEDCIGSIEKVLRLQARIGASS